MRSTFILSIVFLLLFACKTPFVNSSQKDTVPCKPLLQVDNEAFNQATSMFYELIRVEKKESCLVIDVQIEGKAILEHELIWSGAVAKSYPPQATFNLLVKNIKKGNRSTMHRLRYDLSSIKEMDKLMLYFLDDEQAFLYEF